MWVQHIHGFNILAKVWTFFCSKFIIFLEIKCFFYKKNDSLLSKVWFWNILGFVYIRKFYLKKITNFCVWTFILYINAGFSLSASWFSFIKALRFLMDCSRTQFPIFFNLETYEFFELANAFNITLEYHGENQTSMFF